MPSVEEALRRLTIADPHFVAAMAEHGSRDLQLGRLDARTEALLRISALIAVDGPPASYRAPVEAAHRSGATLEDLVVVLVTVAGVVGSARVVSAAPRIALAAGYDVEAALEYDLPDPDAVAATDAATT